MFGWRKKKNELTSYTQSPRMMELYEQITTEDPEFLKHLVGLGEATINNLFVQSVIFKGKKDLREITRTIIFPAAAEHLDLTNLMILHIWMETKGDLTNKLGSDGEMFLRCFMEEIHKLPKGWNEHLS